MIYINKIYPSIMGEVNYYGQGTPCTIVRFQGCSEDCEWCDTVEAQKKERGEQWSISSIVNRIIQLNNYVVLITGGEPFEQKEKLEELISALRRRRFIGIIETNGMHDLLTKRYKGWYYVMDWKPKINCEHPEYENVSERFGKLLFNDYVKFLIRDYSDFENALVTLSVMDEMICVDRQELDDVLDDYLKGTKRKRFILQHTQMPKVALSVVEKMCGSEQLVEWILEERLNVKLNVQIHKLIGLKEK